MPHQDGRVAECVGDLLDTDSAQTITGLKSFSGGQAFTGATSHTGAETHTGVETHSGAETHSGNEAFTGSPTGIVVSKVITFTEGAGTTCTGTVVIPAGAILHDIAISTSVLWDGTSASLKVGDAEDDDGWFTGVDLKATDLLVGEALRASDATTGWGGKNGAYLVAATGRMGQATASKAGPRYETAGSVIGVVTMGTPGTAGRTTMTVTYSVGTVTAATVA